MCVPFFFLLVFAMQEIKLSDSCMLDKSTTAVLHLKPLCAFINTNTNMLFLFLSALCHGELSVLVHTGHFILFNCCIVFQNINVPYGNVC